MKERPIIFSTLMVNAIIEGRKTQTRRVVKPQPQIHRGCGRGRLEMMESGEACWHCERCGYDGRWPCPYGVVGDRLWVKEKHVLLDRDGWWDQTLLRDAFDPFGRRNGVAYADNEHDPDSERCRKALGYRWRPSIHMPRWASRITLEITGVRVERLNEISEDDAIAEGVETHASHYGLPPLKCWGSIPWHRYDGEPLCAASAVESYSTLWDSINRKRHPWSSNQWVFVLEFRRLEANA